MDNTVPRKSHLRHFKSYKSCYVSVSYDTPDNWESFHNRSISKDPTRGCIDPDELPMSGSDTVQRDILRVTVCRPPCKAQAFSLNFFLSHLVHPLELLSLEFGDSDDDDDEEEEEGQGQGQRSGPYDHLSVTKEQAERKMDEAVADGTWAGFELWDAAIVMTEFLLKNKNGPLTKHWLRPGARVVELGCGVGLPGFVCGVAGARVALTDRGVVAELCEENIACVRGELAAQAGDAGGFKVLDMFASELEWTSPESVQKTVDRLGGPPDLIIGTDVIFLPLYGKSNPLLDVLLSLCHADCTVLLSCERRPGDGLVAFFDNSKRDFESKVVEINGNCVVFAMRRRSLPISLA